MQSMVVPVLPAHRDDLGATPSGIAWALTGFLLSSSVLTPLVGRAGDLYGTSRLHREAAWVRTQCPTSTARPADGSTRSAKTRQRAQSRCLVEDDHVRKPMLYCRRRRRSQQAGSGRTERASGTARVVPESMGTARSSPAAVDIAGVHAKVRGEQVVTGRECCSRCRAEFAARAVEAKVDGGAGWEVDGAAGSSVRSIIVPGSGTPASVESVPVAALPVWNLIVRSGAVLIRVRVPRMTFSWFPSVAIQGSNELQIGKWRLLLAHDPILALVDKALCVSRAGLCDGSVDRCRTAGAGKLAGERARWMAHRGAGTAHRRADRDYRSDHHDRDQSLTFDAERAVRSASRSGLLSCSARRMGSGTDPSKTVVPGAGI